MFDIGWTEMLVIAVVMIVVVGPKDLPRMLRTFGKTTAKLRTMAGDFQRQFNDALKEAELDDVKKSVDSLRSLNPAAEIKKQLNPFEKAAADVRAGLDSAMKPSPTATEEPAGEVASSTEAAKPAEPLKNGAAAMPGVSGPEAMPATTPAFPVAEPVASAAAPADKTAAPAAKPAPTKKPAAKTAASSGGKTAAAAKKTPASASAKKKPAATKKSAGSAK
ncbi:twin-arginine translocase subunit TatB [Pseudaminobacter arsenicus]|uniref:Sec-independent protein translocase protein TatB n=1 Tax=Borborobacter arsenicus TaxID=1851146 RepID=A0A432V973_9HYPH|nr:Sec-independent protein translocase protein TatB [Pseudaminobacter arsenicus]RUM98697.1 twin-arginine translocase subunit TatB [Pseudaminobacter arsenicus]